MSTNSEAWENFLGCWDSEISAIEKKENKVQAHLWKKAQRLPVDSIDALEKRLQSKLPQSYKDFLIVSNGQFRTLQSPPWNSTGADFHSIDKVDLFANSSNRTYKIWVTANEDDKIPDEEYFVYGKEQSAPHMRPRYLNEAIEVSHFPAMVEEFILLNPNVKTRDGELETWWLSPRHPGALRYKTFADFMISIYYAEIHDGSLYPTDTQIAGTCAKFLYQRYK
ncbi:SMI1/KNR4 family protein [Undibacterium sp. TC4M20W]|uniref:SMI1/KNR4 family protein n=1 Tax=Undibacterium sp. TC4M20W TaxID=3413052 RepID=UPI003BF1C4E2